MNKEKNRPSININPDQLEVDLAYMRDGFSNIITNNNSGSQNAFANKLKNIDGFLVDKDSFSSLLKSLHIDDSSVKFPPYFKLKIKFSPIVMFKRWIIMISNRDLLKVSQRSQSIEKEYYLLNVDGKYRFIEIITNIAHEKFLVSLFERENIPESNFIFNTFFPKNGELVIYKDYKLDKSSSVQINQKIEPGKLYDVVLSLIKEENNIKFRITVNKGKKLNYNIKLTKSKTTTSIKKTAISDFKSISDYRKEVELLIKESTTNPNKTNKFANISLGRVNRIPILINLSSKYKNMGVIIKFNKKGIIEILNSQKKVIKTFMLAENPKSNWLERVTG